MEIKHIALLALLGIGGLFGLMLGVGCFKIIPEGHVGVRTTFGSVSPHVYRQGFHFPTNPLSGWTLYDCREKTWTETVTIPSRDEQQTTVDLSIQYRVDGSKTPSALETTGETEDLLNVHLVPLTRSISRQVGKTVERAEDFFDEETHTKLQLAIAEPLRSLCADQGLIVSSVLIRDVRLPEHITTAIRNKKVREQLAEEQIAELARYETEQQQLVAQANAQREAAEQEALTRRTLADAKAYEITTINEAAANNPVYVQLEALRTLAEMSNDPSAKFYFMDSDSPQPLPLLNLGGK